MSAILEILYGERIVLVTITRRHYCTAQPNCNGKTLGNMLVPIPPSHEQIRIVEKLNAVIAHVIEYGTIDSRLKHLNNIFPERRDMLPLLKP